MIMNALTVDGEESYHSAIHFVTRPLAVTVSAGAPPGLSAELGAP